ncbi:hypothetical protein MIR68_007629 [Amoeboaphelidium protococcarum]|nr:hypothetical protein MIR68_007629 [Amoeboaphelidium protococcarum]
MMTPSADGYYFDSDNNKYQKAVRSSHGHLPLPNVSRQQSVGRSIIWWVWNAIRSLAQFGKSDQTRRIQIFLALNLLLMVVEYVYGILSNSLGMQSDALHMAFDSFGVFFGLVVALLVGSDQKQQQILGKAGPLSDMDLISLYNKPFGYARLEPLATLINCVFLLSTGVSIVNQAVYRLYIYLIFQSSSSAIADISTGDLDHHSVGHQEGHSHKIELIVNDSFVVVVIAGLLVNMIGIFAFDHHHHHGHGHGSCSHGHDDHSHSHSHGDHDHKSDHSHGHDHDHHGHSHSHKDHGHSHQEGGLIFQSMYLHILGDALGSVSLLLSALVIRYADGGAERWGWLDALCSLGIALLMLYNVVPLMGRCVSIMCSLYFSPGRVLTSTLQMNNPHLESLVALRSKIMTISIPLPNGQVFGNYISAIQDFVCYEVSDGQWFVAMKVFTLSNAQLPPDVVESIKQYQVRDKIEKAVRQSIPGGIKWLYIQMDQDLHKHLDHAPNHHDHHHHNNHQHHHNHHQQQQEQKQKSNHLS